MASAFGHAIAALTVTKVIGERKATAKWFALSILSGIVPDADSLSFKLGIPYGSIFGHRGFTHSILFAFLWSGSLTYIFFGRRERSVRLFVIFFLSILSHGILDAMTTGGLGVGFFIPFENSRYFLPFRPIRVSPIKIASFFAQAQRILPSEFLWIGLPCMGLLALKALWSLSQSRRLIGRNSGNKTPGSA